MTYATLPGQGVVFWPVGTGDSTTIVAGDRLVMQVDLRDMASADEGDAGVAPVIDRLAATLPALADGAPYLAVFALTHGDLDHCCGFGDLLDSDILIGELWATPRLWRELADGQEPCPDAQRFHDEAKRRVTATLKAVAAGRVPPAATGSGSSATTRTAKTSPTPTCPTNTSPTPAKRSPRSTGRTSATGSRHSCTRRSAATALVSATRPRWRCR